VQDVAPAEVSDAFASQTAQALLAKYHKLYSESQALNTYPRKLDITMLVGRLPAKHQL
jgi:hypothetical protein